MKNVCKYDSIEKDETADRLTVCFVNLDYGSAVNVTQVGDDVSVPEQPPLRKGVAHAHGTASDFPVRVCSRRV